MRAILFTITMALSLSAVADSISDRYAEPECQETHTNFSAEAAKVAEVAYAYEWCANYIRKVDQDYKRGWAMHRKATQMIAEVNKMIGCECELHTHADNLAYGTYRDVVFALASGEEVPEERISFCASIP